MSDVIAASYDEVPYESKPEHATHPDHLAAVATLMGLAPAPAGRCRVLELGCGTGGNLLPLAAAYPQSEFVGLDLSPMQIADGTRTADTLGLKNLRLLTASLADVDDSYGAFDYILCHGVYSWVPADVRDRILEVCGQRLAPNGVAYVSYNTYPGWYTRGAARDLMQFHTEGASSAGERVQQARAVLAFAVENLPRSNTAYHRALQDELQWLSKAPDCYVYHEHLEDTNQASYFHEFVARARSHQLQYLGEAVYQTNINSLAPALRETLVRVAPDRVRLEQYLDFLTNRSFRRALLCRAGATPSAAPSAGAVARCFLTANARPDPAQTDPASDEAVEFRTDDGFSAATNQPFIKAALVALYGAWPRCVPFGELWQAVRARLPGLAAEVSPDTLAEAMLQCWLTNVVELHATASPACLTVSERPSAFAVARLQARGGAGSLCNLRHRAVPLDDADRRLVTLLDGTRDAAALRRELGGADDLDARLGKLARNSLLVA